METSTVCLYVGRTCSLSRRRQIAASYGIMKGEHLNSTLASDNTMQRGYMCSALLVIFHVQSQGLWTGMENVEHA